MESEHLTVAQLVALLRELPNQNALVTGEGCDCFNPVIGVSPSGSPDSTSFRVIINVDTTGVFE